jgi:hypothetical protein
MEQHKTDPVYYEGSLSEVASDQRAKLEAKRDEAYANANSQENPILRTKAYRVADMLDVSLDLQGANPKKVDFAVLKDHVRGPAPHMEDLTNQYRTKIKNRATAIRAYCIGCMGGSVSDVRTCATLVCPLHPFRMGKDPLRGYDLPKAIDPEIEIDEDDVGEFEEGDEGDEKDAD